MLTEILIKFIKYIDIYLGEYKKTQDIYGGEYNTETDIYEGEYNYTLQYFEWYNIILLVIAWIFMCSLLDYLLTPSGSVDNRLNGRYRYLCTGTTADKKRCKRRIYNMPTCHQHVSIQEE